MNAQRSYPIPETEEGFREDIIDRLARIEEGMAYSGSHESRLVSLESWRSRLIGACLVLGAYAAKDPIASFVRTLFL